MKMRSLIAAGALMVALAGCSGAVDEAPPSASPSAQQTLTEPIEAEVDSPSEPVEIKLANGNSTRIESVATDVNGVLNPPTDIHVVGWWVDSALPDTQGTVVVAGHINSVSEGDGFADQFIHMQPGEEVSLVTADGDTEKYRVTHTTYTSKETEFPAAELNSLEGPEVLALVTCGGEFVGPPWGYEDNVITWADKVE